MKLCRLCGLPEGTVDFYKHRRVCKNCLAEHRQSVEAKNKKSAYDRERYDPEKSKKQVYEWRKRNPGKALEMANRWRATHLEEARASNRRAAAKIRSLRNETLLERHKKWVSNNIAIVRRAVRKWKRNHPEKVKSYEHKRRAKTNGSNGFFTAQEWLNLCEKYGNKCLRCGQAKPLTPDHVVPLSKGGSNYIENIQPLCKNCNSTKHTQTTDYRN